MVSEPPTESSESTILCPDCSSIGLLSCRDRCGQDEGTGLHTTADLLRSSLLRGLYNNC